MGAAVARGVGQVAGIEVEFDKHYPAMFSYKAKNRQSREKFAEIGRFGICLARMRPRATDGVFCDATNQGVSRSSCAKPRYSARHQYGLQIAEGMVTFFESYERELEKYWTKTLFFQLS